MDLTEQVYNYSNRKLAMNHSLSIAYVFCRGFNDGINMHAVFKVVMFWSSKSKCRLIRTL